MRQPPVVLDSPAWAHHDQLRAERTVSAGSSPHLVAAVFDRGAGHWQLQPDLPAAARAQLTAFRTADLDNSVPRTVRQKLSGLDGLQRLGAASCWEALGTAVIRQVIRAGQARRVWHRLAATLAATRTTAGFPTEERFLAATDGELAEAGLGFKTRTLRVIAEACLAEQHAWNQLSPVQLHDAWLTLPGIGPWSAGAAIADLRHAWQLYPHDDLAVRTWATRAFPELDVPADPRAFLRQWTTWGGQGIGTLTALTLGWSATCPT